MTPFKQFVIRHTFVLSVLALGGLLWLGVYASTTHIDPLRGCAIRLDTLPVSGDRGALRSAVRTLRASDPAAYDTLCTYVDTISEKRCIARDWHIDPSVPTTLHEGCYVRGTRTVYVAPVLRSELSTAERAALLATYAGYSRDFWETGE
jgi:hypothetical protein